MDHKRFENEKIAAVIREAATWRLKIKDDGPLPLPEAWKFFRWVTRSPSHLREYLLICRLDDQLPRKLQTKRNDESCPMPARWRMRTSLKPTKSENQRHRSGWNITATAAVLGPMVVFLVLSRMGSSDGPTGTMVSAPSESNTLGDGARMYPDPGAKWTVRYTDHRREVNLRVGGALFDVYREIKRPLIVTTTLVEIAAVDARFAVRIDRTVEVEVYRGVVEVSGRGAKPGAPVIKVRPGKPYQVPLVAGLAFEGTDGTCSQFQASEWMMGGGGVCDEVGLIARDVSVTDPITARSESAVSFYDVAEVLQSISRGGMATETAMVAGTLVEEELAATLLTAFDLANV